MAYLETIESHNDRLEALKAKVDELPEAGSGGSYETCTLTISMSSGMGVRRIDYVCLENGQPTLKRISNDMGYITELPVTLNDILCNSMLNVEFSANECGFIMDGLILGPTVDAFSKFTFLITAPAGYNVTLELVDND